MTSRTRGFAAMLLVLLAWDGLSDGHLFAQVVPNPMVASPWSSDSPYSSGSEAAWEGHPWSAVPAPSADAIRAYRSRSGDPRGAEDYAAEGHLVQIPEPLLFDLVRPLGAKKGELEFNTLAVFPWGGRGGGGSDGSGSPGDVPNPDVFRSDAVLWAPEVEYAFADGHAIEFEFPFEGSKFESYKVGLQSTFGTAFDNRYIHGLQILVEPTREFEEWNTTFLYLSGIRFDEVWSAMLMTGFRLDLEGPRIAESFERLFNASLFADVNEFLTLGVETNTAIRQTGQAEFVLVPQAHIELTDFIQVQSGLGFGFADNQTEHSFILRAIYSR